VNSYFYLSKILSPFLSIINILFLFLIINIILYFFFKKKIVKNLILISFIVIFIIGFFPVGSFFLKSIEKKYYEQIKLEDVDAIAVLAGDINIIQTSKFNKIHFNKYVILHENEVIIYILNYFNYIFANLYGFDLLWLIFAKESNYSKNTTNNL